MYILCKYIYIYIYMIPSGRKIPDGMGPGIALYLPFCVVFGTFWLIYPSHAHTNYIVPTL